MSLRIGHSRVASRIGRHERQRVLGAAHQLHQFVCRNSVMFFLGAVCKCLQTLVNRWHSMPAPVRLNPYGLLASLTTFACFACHDGTLLSSGHLLQRGSSHTLFP
jgi:fluoride ion exporter CrcB/FEX